MGVAHSREVRRLRSRACPAWPSTPTRVGRNGAHAGRRGLRPHAARALGAALLATWLGGCFGTGAKTAKPDEAVQHVARRPFEHAPGNLVEALETIAAELRSVGLVQYGPTASGFLPAGGRQAFAVTLEGDRCMTMVAIATPGVTDMDAALYTPDGEMLAADSQPDSHPAIHVCGTGTTRTVYYVVHSYEGAGSFLMASFSGGRQAVDAVAERLGGRPAVASNPHGGATAREALRDFGEGLYRRGFRSRGEPSNLALAERQRIRVRLSVEPGHCYAVAAFADAPISQLDLRVLDERGEELVGDQAPLSNARVQFCARAGGTYAAETHAVVGEGRALLGVYAAPAHEVLGDSGMWLGRPGKPALAPKSRGDVLAKESEQARADGYALVHARFEGQLGVGEAVEHTLTVGRRPCLRVVLAPEEGLLQSTVELLRADGQRVQHPVDAGDPQPFEQCAVVGEQLKLRVLAKAGSGAYTATVFSRAR